MRRALTALAVVVCVAACGQADTASYALGADLDAGREVFSRSCASCHGGGGQGASAPALTEVGETFGSCEDQIRWVTLGSDRHREEVGDTYGDTGKEITGVMPSFDDVLTDEQIAQVVAFERHRFGAIETAEALADCGL